MRIMVLNDNVLTPGAQVPLWAWPIIVLRHAWSSWVDGARRRRDTQKLRVWAVEQAARASHGPGSIAYDAQQIVDFVLDGRG